MLTVQEMLDVMLMEKALGGPMRADDCPTVVRMGGHVRPHDLYPPTPLVEPAVEPAPPVEEEKK